MIVPFDDLELVYQSLRTLEPPHTHKFPRVNAQDCKLGPIQPWDVKDFLRPGRGRDGPVSLLKTYERSYPFGWLGIMSETPPFPELRGT